MFSSNNSFSSLGEFLPTGDLAARLQLNFDRLEASKYQPQNVFQRKAGADSWPGDTEGRTILALVLLAQATGRTPRYLDEILGQWPNEMNRLGYLGEIYPADTISEQQLSGHGWVLRAFSELERWRPGGIARTLVMPVIEHLILPTAGQHCNYPLGPASRESEGSFSGTQIGQMGHWLLSSDVGCDFICLDGIVDAYDAFREERLRPVIEEMVARFLQLDLIAVKAQTHATLTACRALLRWATLSHDDSLVGAVIERYARYTQNAWTEHYANFNWFGRPQWTEPCAIVDSLMVAMELWRRTGRTTYLEHAQHIYFNALAHAQRGNGGFGCDNCPGADEEDDLFFKVYEAHWCCTMRGGEGLSRLCQYNLARSGTTMWLPFGLSGEVHNADWSLVIDSSYPIESEVMLRVRAEPHSRIESIALFVPPWSTELRATNSVGAAKSPASCESWLYLPVGEKEEEWRVTGVLIEGLRAPVNPSALKRPRVVRFRGPLLLANGPGTEQKTEPIFSAYASGITDPAASHRRLLLPDE